MLVASPVGGAEDQAAVPLFLVSLSVKALPLVP
jgi:hypothetical protein